MSKRRNWIFCIVVGIVTVLMSFLPDPVSTRPGQLPRAQVRVLSVDNGMMDPLGLVFSGVQPCEVEITQGRLRGRRMTAQNYLNAALDKDKVYQPGDLAIAMVHESPDSLTGTLVDHDRRGITLLLFGLFALFLTAFGGITGAGALISLCATVVMIWKVYFPLLIAGFSPVMTALGLVVILTVMIDLLVGGLTRMSLAAMLGSLGGTAVTLALAAVFIRLFRLDGGGMPYIVPLLSQSGMTFDMNQLFLSTVFICNSGALMDLSMDIAAACAEVKLHAPEISRRRLMGAGFSVGRAVIGTMTTTLILAYAGSYLTMMLYFQAQGTPLMDVMNYRFVASEIMITLVGSFGLVSVAPLTAAVSSFLLTGGKAGQPDAARP